MSKFNGDYKGTVPSHLKDCRLILQGLNGSLLWFNSEDNQFLVTSPIPKCLNKTTCSLPSEHQVGGRGYVISNRAPPFDASFPHP